jgi:hypothetical protein
MVGKGIHEDVLRAILDSSAVRKVLVSRHEDNGPWRFAWAAHLG